jgi:hypothetical protein
MVAMLTLNDITSRGLITCALGFAILFYGGATQIFQLGVVTLLLIGVVSRLNWSIRHDKIFWSKAHTVLAVYALLLVVNIYTSEFAENSLIVAWLFLVMPMTVLVCGRTNDDYWRILLPLMCIPMSVSVFWGYTEFFLTEGRASGAFIDPNSWASGLNLFFCVLAAWFFRANGRTASAVFVLLGLVSAATFMAYSRVGNVVFASAFVFMSIIALSMHASRRRAVVLIMLVSAAYFSVHEYRDVELATKNNEGYTLNVESVGWSQRLAQWQAGIEQYQDYPLGSGLGTFKVLYPQYRTLGDAYTAGNYVHNDYIQLLAEGGPVLVGFVLLLLSFLLWQLFQALRRLIKSQRSKDFEIILLITALGSLFVHATMNFTFYILANQLLMGCVLARVLWLTGYCKEQTFQLHSPGLVRSGLVIAAVYVLVLNYADAISNDLVYQGGSLPLDRHDPSDQLQIYEILSGIKKLRPNNSANQFAMAIFYRTSFDQQPVDNEEGRRSLAVVTAFEYQNGLAINPFSLDSRRFFAEFLDENPWLMEVDGIDQTPEQLIRDGLAQAPFQMHRQLMLAEYLISHDREDEAYDLLKSGLNWAPMRYDDYQKWRTEFYVKLLRIARARDDRETLNLLLATVERH